MNDLAARVVATGVVAMCAAILVWHQTWMLVPLAYGFWARVLTGPTASPLGQLATRLVAPRLPFRARLVPGPPKRFAQAIGVTFSTAALVCWFGFGAATATWAVVGALGLAAFLEAAAGLCLGCKLFALLMRVGIVPASVCAACSDITIRHPQLRREPARA